MTNGPAPQPDRPDPPTVGRLRRAAGTTGGAAGAVLVVTASLLAGYGWLYMLRGIGWLGLGPPVTDSLPLLQLAGFDRQPLLRVVVAWLLAGAIAGVTLIRLSPLRRAGLAGVLGLVLLLFASQTADALTRNLRLSHVLLSRRPGLGPVLEGVLFAAGCLLPRPLAGAQRGRRRRLPPVPRISRRGQLRLGGGQHR